MPEDSKVPGVEPRRLGRYTLFDAIAAGGMATVHFGRLLGPAGFARTVAIKCLHPQYAKSPDFVTMFLDEARLAARIRHPNVVSTLDVVARDGELFLVMEYVQGESFARLIRASDAARIRPSPNMVSSVMVGVLLGLHAAHEAKSEQGESLHIVHRDVSPQNVLVGVDGVARVLDFGVAKATSRLQTTEDGSLKGKVAYMSPEQLMKQPVDRRTDIFAASVMLWEALVGKRLFASDDVGGTVAHILHGDIERPSRLAPGLDTAVDEVVLRGLARRREDRFSTAREMAQALEAVLPPVSAMRVGDWVESVARATLQLRAEVVARIEDTDTRLQMTKQDLRRLLDEPNAQEPAHPPVRRTELLASRDAETMAGIGAALRDATDGTRTVEEATSMSSMSVLAAAAEAVPRRRPMRPRVFALMGLFAFLTLLGVYLKSRTPAAVVASEPERLQSLPLHAQPERPVLSASPDPPAPPASGSASAVPLALAGSSRPATQPHTVKPAPLHHPAARDCDVPYVIDASGAKRFKPQCF